MPRAGNGKDPVPVRGFSVQRENGSCGTAERYRKCGIFLRQSVFPCLAECDKIAEVKDSRKDSQHFGGFYDS